MAKDGKEDNSGFKIEILKGIFAIIVAIIGALALVYSREAMMMKNESGVYNNNPGDNTKDDNPFYHNRIQYYVQPKITESKENAMFADEAEREASIAAAKAHKEEYGYGVFEGYYNLKGKVSKGRYIGEINADGDILDGGYGIIKYENGDSFSGKFKDGIGVYTWSNGNSFKGQLDSYGIYKCNDYEYVGGWDFKKRQRIYAGECTYLNGESYIGEWENDRHEGYGIMYDENGVVKEFGNWINNRIIR